MFGENDNKHSRYRTTGSRNYETMYNQLSQEFWELQQTKQTIEEAEYETLCKELEGMLVQFRDEIDLLEKENQELQSQLENVSEIKQKYQELCIQEENLINLKKSLI